VSIIENIEDPRFAMYSSLITFILGFWLKSPQLDN
jgi:hypothetical protein